MTVSNPTEILFHHDRWATGNLIKACRALKSDQLNQQFAIGCGSLHDTLNHILGAMQRWGDFLLGAKTAARFEETPHSLDDLERHLAEFSGRLAAVAGAPHDELLSGERGGRTLTVPRGVVLMHVATHGVHHRAQALNMLRQLGISPLPSSSVMDWAQTGGP